MSATEPREGLQRLVPCSGRRMLFGEPEELPGTVVLCSVMLPRRPPAGHVSRDVRGRIGGRLRGFCGGGFRLW